MGSITHENFLTTKYFQTTVYSNVVKFKYEGKSALHYLLPLKGFYNFFITNTDVQAYQYNILIIPIYQYNYNNPTMKSTLERYSIDRNLSEY